MDNFKRCAANQKVVSEVESMGREGLANRQPFLFDVKIKRIVGSPSKQNCSR